MPPPALYHPRIMPEPTPPPSHHGNEPVLVIGDLHLDPARPEMIGRFEDFCAGPARSAQALYILGDLFEVWIGDDDDDPGVRRVLDALATLTQAAEVPVWFMAGNRDFLVGERFHRQTGARALPDEQLIDLFGHPTLLCHGDTLCTDDVDYQRFRSMVRDEEWQREFLARPLAERRHMAENLRRDSGEAMAGKADTAMDVNGNAVIDAVRRHGAERLIHGHTHRPGMHLHEVEGRTVERWVLGDWYREASMLVATQSGIEPRAL